MMLRTRQHRGMDENSGKLKIAQLDQSLRSIAKEMDVKLFTWGDKLEGWLKCDPFGIPPLEQLELISGLYQVRGPRSTLWIRAQHLSVWRVSSLARLLQETRVLG